MKNWIIATLVLLLLSSNGFLLFLIVDEAVTHNYHLVSYKRLEDKEEVYKKLSNHYLKKLSFKEKEVLLYKLFDKSDILKKENILVVGGVRFKRLKSSFLTDN